MNHLIEPIELAKLINENKSPKGAPVSLKTNKNLVIADIRWYGNNPAKAFKDYQDSHILGAIFIDLDKELSYPELQELKIHGRHPLPDPKIFAKFLTEKGIGQDSIIVAYDDNSGAMASRFWWMLKWINGPEVKILNGGFQAWNELNLPVESGMNDLPTASKPIIPQPKNDMFVNKKDLETAINDHNTILIDARDKDRYLGLSEPIDPVAGHIPGAINSPFKENMNSENVPKFKSVEEIRKHFQDLGVNENSNVISYCGSGVTACHNILALEMAGFSNIKLYPGSWSEWCNS